MLLQKNMVSYLPEINETSILQLIFLNKEVNRNLLLMTYSV